MEFLALKLSVKKHGNNKVNRDVVGDGWKLLGVESWKGWMM